ncbi:Ubiquitinconjugating enzyme subfamily protein [Balamuthia mandrillaris]
MSTPLVCPTDRKKYAVRRLLTDLKELQQQSHGSWNQTHLISALPLDNNIFCWHVNIRSSPPLRSHKEEEEVVYHLRICFPETYPLDPPNIFTFTPIPHPQVFGSRVCLGLLEKGGDPFAPPEQREYSGWSSGYSVLSILIQLSCFLTDSEGACPSKSVREEAMSFRCKTCPHHPSFGRIWPPFNHNTVVNDETSLRNGAAGSGLTKKKMTTIAESLKIQMLKAGFVKQGAESQAKETTRHFHPNGEMRKNRRRRRRGKQPPKGTNETEESRTKTEQPEDGHRGEEEEPQEQQEDTSDLERLPEELLLHIIRFCLSERRSLPTLSLVSRRWNRLCKDKLVWLTLSQLYFPKEMLQRCGTSELTQRFRQGMECIKEGLRCFYTKLHVDDEHAEEDEEAKKGVVLGMPLNIELGVNRHHNWSFISQISCITELLSAHAFYYEGVRKTAWKKPFQYWIPVYISAAHWQKARPYWRHAVQSITEAPRYNPMLALEVLPKLMSTMTVQLMTGETFASFRALEGYCSFHRLFLEIVTNDSPELQEKISAIIDDFISSSNGRTKRAVPSLGEFLPLLSVSDRYTWEHVKEAYLDESFDRHAKWILQKYPHLEVFEGFEEEELGERLEQSFEAVQVGARLLLFNVYFLTKFTTSKTNVQSKKAKERRTEEEPFAQALEEAKREYDAFYGASTPRQQEELQQEVRNIGKVSDWKAFFEYLGMEVPSRERMCFILKQAVVESERKFYHQPSIQRDVEEVEFYRRRSALEIERERREREREAREAREWALIREKTKARAQEERKSRYSATSRDEVGSWRCTRESRGYQQQPQQQQARSFAQRPSSSSSSSSSPRTWESMGNWRRERRD